MSFSSSVEIFSQLADAYNDNKTGHLFLKNATLIDLTEALGAVFVGFKTTEETSPPQVKYNTTIISAFENQRFFSFVTDLLNRLYDFYNSDFGFCTVNMPLGKFPRPSREEFQENKHLYVFNHNLNLCLDEVYPLEIIRAVRLHLMTLLFRFFKTYDVNETYVAKDGKKHYICDASQATYRSNGNSRTTTEFLAFVEYLIEANRYIKQLSVELTEFSEPFRAAALAAKAERVQQAQQAQQAQPSFRKTFKNADTTHHRVRRVRAPVTSEKKASEVEETQAETPVVETDDKFTVVVRNKNPRFRTKRS